MNTNVSVRFFLKNDKTKKYQSKVYVRITNNRKKSEFATDINTYSRYWDERYSCSKNDKEVNQKLTLIESDIYRVKEQLILEGHIITAKLIKDVYTGKDKIQYGIVEFIHRFIAKKEKVTTLSKTYKGKFSTLSKLVSKFVKQEYKVEDINLVQVDYSFLTSFDGFLKSQNSVQYKKPFSPTYVNKLHAFLRTVIIQAFREGLIKKQPYTDFKLRKVKTDIKYLTREELTRLEEMDLNGQSSLQKALDVFLFSVYTGLRYKDAQSVTLNNIERVTNDSSFIITTQEKTGDAVEIPILKPTQRLIDKYSDSKDREKLGLLIPKISNARINFYLKVIADLADIKLKLTHHVARHSCATTILLENNVPMEQVSKWLGHADISSTKVYGKITKSRLMNTADLLNSMIE